MPRTHSPHRLAEAAKLSCPVSRALAGVDITLYAALVTA
jgi:organic hydroperoxide reductase OsmC/OhrA